MSGVLEKLHREIERVQLLRSRRAEMFEAAMDPTLLRAAFENFDEDGLFKCNMYAVGHVLKHLGKLHSLLVTERDVVLKEESIPGEPKVEMKEDGYGYRLHISSMKWDGDITAILEAIESVGLTVVRANISCDKQLLFDAFLQEEAEASGANMRGDVENIM